MSERELIEFNGELVTVNIFLEKKSVDELKTLWTTRVDGCQPPLIETHKNGLHLFIPWVLKDE